MEWCIEIGCKRKEAPSKLVRAEIQAINQTGFFCTGCEAFWPVETLQEIDPDKNCLSPIARLEEQDIYQDETSFRILDADYNAQLKIYRQKRKLPSRKSQE